MDSGADGVGYILVDRIAKFDWIVDRDVNVFLTRESLVCSRAF